MLEKKCCTGMEKLKALLEGYLLSRIPLSDILDKSKSTLRKPMLTGSGSSKYVRDLARLFPDAEDDSAPLYLC